MVINNLENSVGIQLFSKKSNKEKSIFPNFTFLDIFVLI